MHKALLFLLSFLPSTRHHVYTARQLTTLTLAASSEEAPCSNKAFMIGITSFPSALPCCYTVSASKTGLQFLPQNVNLKDEIHRANGDKCWWCRGGKQQTRHHHSTECRAWMP